MGMQAQDVTIRDQEIKLGQFIKLDNLVDTRRGKTLRDGDVVCIGTACARVVAGAADDDDYFDEKTANDDFDPEVWRNM